MKALVLAAGFGTRLAPYTDHTPKPLFPVGGRPLLDRVIGNLCRAGCTAVVVNTHHHPDRIARFVASRGYPIPVITRHEPEILGTGGAIRNLADFWGSHPFLVVNSDIVTDIDLGRVYADHLAHPYPATLVLTDSPEFNTVSVTDAGFVAGFSGPGGRRLAFTGIQALDPDIIDWIPPEEFSTSIDAYRRIISAGGKIKAWVAEGCRWEDIGTPRRYFSANRDMMTPEAFRLAHGHPPSGPVTSTPLAGDGSDRRWFRLEADNRTMVLCDHGIRPSLDRTAEVDATVAIGRHLHGKGLPVPEIYLFDRFPGLVFAQDLGDVNLQAVVNSAATADVVTAYASLVTLLVSLSQKGAEGFDPLWAWQSPVFDRDLILEKECRYFIEAFMAGYLGISADPKALIGDFRHLADRALADGVSGFMHRDLQSRNIMVREGRFYLIDYQGGRIGPIQYDLASLLIDPYVNLPQGIKNQMVDRCARELSSRRRLDPDRFRQGFNYCAVSRNLQILGAFGFLTRQKNKKQFEQYIPTAVDTLKQQLSSLADPGLARLKDAVDKID